jgi:hypothetical protein
MVWNLLCKEGCFDHVIMAVFERSCSLALQNLSKYLEMLLAGI